MKMNIKKHEMISNLFKRQENKALKDLKITGEGVDIDNMILFSKYECEVLENGEAETLSDGLYSLDFKAKIKPITGLTIYFDDKMVNNFSEINNYTSISYSYVSGSSNVINSYKVVDKYYGLIFDVYEMDNVFNIDITIDSSHSSTVSNTHIIQKLAVLRNGEQTNERILDKVAILKYCEVNFDDASLPTKKSYIIKYSNNETTPYIAKENTFTFKGLQFIISDDLLINSSDKLIVTVNQSEDAIYDENEYSISYDSTTITFTKI